MLAPEQQSLWQSAASGVSGVFRHINGVVSGYAGGESHAAQYNIVGSGQMGHAESVRTTFDPSKISCGWILSDCESSRDRDSTAPFGTERRSFLRHQITIMCADEAFNWERARGAVLASFRPCGVGRAMTAEFALCRSIVQEHRTPG
jgi:hypothetical protein